MDNSIFRAPPKSVWGFMSGKIDCLERFVKSLSNWLSWVAGAGLVAMIGLIVVDVIGIKLFNWPVPGAIEMVGFLGIVVTAFAIAYTQVLHGHIQVEFFIMRSPRRVRASVTAFASLLGVALFALLAWRSFDFALILQASGEVSMTQRIPFYPFVHALSFCCIPVCLVLLVEFLKSVTEAVKK